MRNSMLIINTDKSKMTKICESKRMECIPKYNDRVNVNRWIKLYHKVQVLLCYSNKESSKSTRRKKQKHCCHHDDDDCSIDFCNTTKKNTQSSNSTMIRLISRKMMYSNNATGEETICDHTQHTDHTETYYESVQSLCYLHSVLQQFHDIELPSILNDNNDKHEYHLKNHHISIPDSFYSFFKDAQESLLLLLKDKPTTTVIKDSSINNNINNNTKEGSERKGGGEDSEDIKDVQYIRYETFVPLESKTYSKTLPTIMELYGEEDNEYIEYQEEFNTSYNWNCDDASYVSSVSMGVISSCSSRGQGTIVSI